MLLKFAGKQGMKAIDRRNRNAGSSLRTSLKIQENKPLLPPSSSSLILILLFLIPIIFAVLFITVIVMTHILFLLLLVVITTTAATIITVIRALKTRPLKSQQDKWSYDIFKNETKNPMQKYVPLLVQVHTEN